MSSIKCFQDKNNYKSFNIQSCLIQRDYKLAAIQRDLQTADKHELKQKAQLEPLIAHIAHTEANEAAALALERELISTQTKTNQTLAECQQTPTIVPTINTMPHDGETLTPSLLKSCDFLNSNFFDLESTPQPHSQQLTGMAATMPTFQEAPLNDFDNNGNFFNEPNMFGDVSHQTGDALTFDNADLFADLNDIFFSAEFGDTPAPSQSVLNCTANAEQTMLQVMPTAHLVDVVEDKTADVPTYTSLESCAPIQTAVMQIYLLMKCCQYIWQC